MFQAEMFTNKLHGKFLGGGCFGEVHEIGTSGWVIKTTSSRDGTLNYLEWCKRMQDAGDGMLGMPEIDFLVRTERGYIVTMRKYDKFEVDPLEPSSSRWDIPDDCAHLQELKDAFNYYMLYEFGCENFANDCHMHNYMVDASGVLILTDPSSRSYRTHIEPPAFQLH